MAKTGRKETTESKVAKEPKTVKEPAKEPEKEL